jgi:hypothetical protein
VSELTPYPRAASEREEAAAAEEEAGVRCAGWWRRAGALLDYLWPLWDGRNQTLHDKVANSIVVRV